MIYRNQITNPNQFSLNPILNKQRKQKYKIHLQKIFQIKNKPIKTQSRQNAKKIQQQIIQLTKLKEFSRNYQAKLQNIERARNDVIMLHHIHQRLSTNPNQQLLRKTRSTIKLKNRQILTQRNLKSGKITNQIRQQNQRLMKSITQNSFDQHKFRQTLKSSTKKYLKVRDHMRRLKTNQQSIKRLTSCSLNRSSTTKLLQSTTNQQTTKGQNMKSEQAIQDLYINKSKLKMNAKLKQALHSSTTSIFKPMKLSKNNFKIKEGFTAEIMLKKLKNIE